MPSDIRLNGSAGPKIAEGTVRERTPAFLESELRKVKTGIEQFKSRFTGIKRAFSEYEGGALALYGMQRHSKLTYEQLNRRLGNIKIAVAGSFASWATYTAGVMVSTNEWATAAFGFGVIALIVMADYGYQIYEKTNKELATAAHEKVGKRYY